MQLTAKTNPWYLGKFLLIGLFALPFGLYHLFDAAVTFPAEMPIAQAYENVSQTGLTDADVQSAWRAKAAENGWPEEEPEHPVSELEYFIRYNYFMGAIFTTLGSVCLAWALMNLGSKVESDDDSVFNGKQRVRFEQIHEIDKARWEKKGIAKLLYTDNGNDKVFVVDDLKHDREITDQIMALVEQRVGEDKITNGISEAEHQRLVAEAKAERERVLAEEAQQTSNS